MQCFFFRWLCFCVLSISFTSCTRGSYPVTATGTATIKIKLAPIGAQSIDSSATQPAPAAIAPTPPATPTRLCTALGRQCAAARSRRAPLPTQSVAHPLASNSLSANQPAPTKHHTTSAAAGVDPFVVLALAYTVLIVVGIVFLVRFIVRWLRKRKAKT